eukprot:TRINITY_DN1079_c0_g1_i1.p1 TRINITY_DN1079_c0_g1~~TRINITY_DN1079_c0_g1_i1.p1  ORF type:complete len:323 (-),score=10.99 TRINITY_DN1079_c0_g1_i1:543-1403(-)
MLKSHVGLRYTYPPDCRTYKFSALASESRFNRRNCRSLGTRVVSQQVSPYNQFDVQSRRESLDQLELLSRQLNLAISEENYQLAAEYRGQKSKLLSSFSIAEQQVIEVCEELRKAGNQSEQVRLIKQLTSYKSNLAIPTIAQFLLDQDIREIAETAMWQIWTYHPNIEVERLMQEGSSFLYNKNFEGALTAFDKMLMIVPSYAEAHNKRATVLYLLQRYMESIEACKIVIELEPYHFGAMSGMGFCYLYLGQNQEALNAFRQAVSVNPGLSQISSFIAKLAKDIKE